MMPTKRDHSRASQRGLTLVELMVAIVIGLLLVLAAATLYINTRATQRAVDQRAASQETGQQVLELLGREVANAGFYPMEGLEPAAANTPSKSNLFTTFSSATQSLGLNATDLKRWGLAGCSGQAIKTDGTCEAHDATVIANNDALVVSYFTRDAFSLDQGLRSDCAHRDVANAPINSGRVGTIEITKPSKDPNTPPTKEDKSRIDEGLPPTAPLLVANAYGVRPNGRGTRSLFCLGNGTAQPGYEELIPNVEQISIRYGLASTDTLEPSRYFTASQVAALTDAVVINGVSLQPWERVVSVSVCVMVRSDPQTRLQGVTQEKVNDCAGSEVTQPAGVQYRTFRQVFGVKNRLTLSI